MYVQPVIGLLFGDEGKGRVVSSLARKALENGRHPLVIRYSGASNAGHRVVCRTLGAHVFCNMGSGTLSGVPTYRTEDTLIDPLSLKEELDIYCQVSSHRPKPVLFLHRDSQIITPADVVVNRQGRDYLRNGTTGTGLSPAVERINAGYSFKISDILHPRVARARMRGILSYHAAKYTTVAFSDSELEADMFLSIMALEQLMNDPRIELHIVNERPIEWNDKWFDHLILEGSQGVLLDEKTGFFPHVTRGRVGIAKVLETLSRFDLEELDLFPVYVARHYLTRHGAGPMGSSLRVSTAEFLKENALKDEVNKTNPFQGKFKTEAFNYELMRYALESEYYDGLKDRTLSSVRLVMTCADHVPYPEKIRKQVPGIDRDGNPELHTGLSVLYTDSPYVDSPIKE